ncbi:CdaR family transcriptional regulator [Amycolatopsis minnesotensis]|uniref:Sugar diacid recognition domain-containing protein n=1 Tax=Amycolatopsis minnesotensis TaxID=337894 RepID=A0ABN2RM90_9PSEU
MSAPLLTSELAQEIARETSTIIGLNVLITGRDAVVIGSGDAARVGTVHEASVEVLRTGEPATHSAEQARALHGVRPGITLPIVIDGVAVGTVGLTGSPRRVRQFGLVVQRQTEILLRESTLVRSRLLREQALEDLLRDIALYDADVVEPGALAARARELGLDPTLTRTAIVIEAREAEAPRTIREVFGDPQDVVGEISAGRYAVLHHAASRAELGRRAGLTIALLRERHGTEALAGTGEPATDVAGLHRSYTDAAAALRLGSKLGGDAAVFPIDGLRVPQLLETTAHEARARFVAGQLGGLGDDPNRPALVATVIAWCESGFNLVRAAKALHVHRNTLVYRLDKLTRLSGQDIRDPARASAVYLACLAERVGFQHAG